MKHIPDTAQFRVKSAGHGSWQVQEFIGNQFGGDWHDVWPRVDRDEADRVVRCLKRGVSPV